MPYSFAGEVQGFGADSNSLRIQIDFNIAGTDDWIWMAFGAADNSLDAGQKFCFIKRFGQVVICAVAQAFDFFIRFG